MRIVVSSKVMDVPQRRIDDQLRRICKKALTASDQERERILAEMLELVHAKSERLKRRAAKLLLSGKSLEPERRDTENEVRRPKLIPRA